MGLHKYDLFLFDENKAHVNWPNKDPIAVLIKRKVIYNAPMTPIKVTKCDVICIEQNVSTQRSLFVQ